MKCGIPLILYSFHVRWNSILDLLTQSPLGADELKHVRMSVLIPPQNFILWWAIALWSPTIYLSHTVNSLSPIQRLTQFGGKSQYLFIEHIERPEFTQQTSLAIAHPNLSALGGMGYNDERAPFPTTRKLVSWATQGWRIRCFSCEQTYHYKPAYGFWASKLGFALPMLRLRSPKARWPKTDEKDKKRVLKSTAFKTMLLDEALAVRMEVAFGRLGVTSTQAP